MALPPEAPQGAPAPGPEAPAPGGEEAQGGKVAALMSDTFKNLSMLAELATSAGDQAMSQKLQAMKAQFESLLDGGGDAPQAGGGQVPMEAGGAQVRPVV
jgi:hypothetical protein